MKPGKAHAAIITGSLILACLSLSDLLWAASPSTGASSQRRPLRHQPMTQKIRQWRSIYGTAETRRRRMQVATN